MITTQDGNASDDSTWLGGTAPGATDPLDIQHNIYINGNFECDSISIGNDKTLSLENADVKAGAVSLGDGHIRAASGSSRLTATSLEMGSNASIETTDWAQLKIGM